MKKGISLVVLVITIVVLALITGAIMSIVNNQSDTKVINEYGKKAIIEDLNIKIKKAKLKNEIQGINELTMEEIIPIIKEHGTFNNNILKLTTTKGIEIWLYEIMQIPLEEYTTITYENSMLTVQTELINNGYRVQYTTDAGSSWSLYNNPVTVSEESGIQIRLINEAGQVVSNTLKITGGVIGEVDNESPIITIEPNGIGLAKNTQVTITVTDNNELANNNTYEYYLSTSSTTQAGGSWITYTNGTAFTIGTNLTGTYYLHVKPIYDVAGNTSGNVVSQSYTFDNSEPQVTISKELIDDKYIFTFTWNEEVIDFTIDDIIVAGGTKGSFTKINNYTYQLEVGNLTELMNSSCYVINNACTDNIGNSYKISSTHIYASGNQYNSLTGGWVAGITYKYLHPQYSHTANKVSPTFQTNSIYFPALTGGVQYVAINTTNKIDLSNYSTIYIDISISSYGLWRGHLFVSDILAFNYIVLDAYYNTSSNQYLAYTRMVGDVNTRQIFACDISKISGLHYIGVSTGRSNGDGTHYGGAITIHNIWLI